MATRTIGDKLKRVLNQITQGFKLGVELDAIIDEVDSDLTALETAIGDSESGIAKDVSDLQSGAVIAKKFTLAEGDINTGVATVDMEVEFTDILSVMVVSSAGAVRVITAITQGTGEGNTTKVIITATEVAATDIATVIVK